MAMPVKKMPGQWQSEILLYASQHPEESLAAYCRWAGIHESTLYKYRKANPDFDDELQRRKAGEFEVHEDGAVGIEEFILSPDYLGLEGRVWPVVLKELKEINSGAYDLCLLVGSIGSAKTYCATLSLLYQLYRLLLIPDLHKQFQLDKNSPIILAVQNRSRKLAERNDYSLARNLIEASPWFKKNAPHDQRLKSRIKFLHQNIELWAASGDVEDLLGMNLFALILDEANFFARVEKSKRSVHGGAFDGAREAFEGALRRKQSRFPDGAGMFFVASSKRYKGQITDQLMQEFADSETTYSYDHNQWSIRPEKYVDSEWFHVFVGDRLRAARVLDKDEETDPKDGSLIISVPERFRRAFERDTVRSLQDIAGQSTEISGAFFQDKEALGRAACLDQVLIGNSDAIGNATHLLPEPNAFVMCCPDSPRIVHGDLSLTGDLTGLAVGHIHAFDKRGLPEIVIDGIGRVHPPRNGAIEIDSVYRFIEALKRSRIPIQWFSCDGYQSADILQRVKRIGIRAGKISVDMTSPGDPMQAYETLRNAISEGRFRFPDDAETVEDMLWLQVDYEKQRVDHLPNRKKDTADCLAAIAYHLTHNVRAFELVGTVEGAGFAAAVANPRTHSRITDIPPPRLSPMNEIRLRRGMPYRG